VGESAEAAQGKVVKLFSVPFELMQGLIEQLFQNVQWERRKPFGVEGENDPTELFTEVLVYRQCNLLFIIAFLTYVSNRLFVRTSRTDFSRISRHESRVLQNRSRKFSLHMSILSINVVTTFGSSAEQQCKGKRKRNSRKEIKKKV